jgi:hypothetical protein
MTALPSLPDSEAEEQASLWAARLEGGTLSAVDRDALDAWLNADRSHRPLLSRYCQFSVDLEEQLLALVASGAVTLPAEPAEPAAGGEAAATGGRLLTWSPRRVAMAAFAAAAAVALLLWMARPGPQVAEASTGAAQRRADAAGWHPRRAQRAYPVERAPGRGRAARAAFGGRGVLHRQQGSGAAVRGRNPGRRGARDRHGV